MNKEKMDHYNYFEDNFYEGDSDSWIKCDLLDSLGTIDYDN